MVNPAKDSLDIFDNSCCSLADSGQPTMEEQNGYSDVKDGVEDKKGSCDERVGKQETSCCNEHVKGCRECDPAHDESLIRCCDGKSSLVI